MVLHLCYAGAAAAAATAMLASLIECTCLQSPTV
jgi:hypothetical protein